MALVSGELTFLKFADKRTELNLFEQQLGIITTKGCRYLVCTEVPVHVSAIEFSEFIAPLTKEIKHIRVLKGNHKEVYVIVMKLESAKAAQDFVAHFQNLPFNSIEPE